MHIVVRGALASVRRGAHGGPHRPGRQRSAGSRCSRASRSGSQVVADEDSLTLELDADARRRGARGPLPDPAPHPARDQPPRDRAADAADSSTRPPACRRCPRTRPARARSTSSTASSSCAGWPSSSAARSPRSPSSAVRWRRCASRPGTTLWHEGEPGPGIFLLRSGTVRRELRRRRRIPGRPGLPARGARGARRAAALVRRGHRDAGRRAAGPHERARGRVRGQLRRWRSTTSPSSRRSTLRIVEWAAARAASPRRCPEHASPHGVLAAGRDAELS